MIITLTGTPGTGKTTVSEKLDGFKVIDLTRFVREHGLGEDVEKEFEVDIQQMKDELEKKVGKDEDVIVEGHLSHHFPSDYCVVLRCNPEELEERLRKRDYSESKIKENIESEKLDVILTEAVDKQEKIIEVDTTDMNAGETAKEIMRKIEKDETEYGNTDWTDQI